MTTQLDIQGGQRVEVRHAYHQAGDTHPAFVTTKLTVLDAAGNVLTTVVIYGQAAIFSAMVHFLDRNGVTQLPEDVAWHQAYDRAHGTNGGG